MSDSTEGRWLTPDPMGGDIWNPQSLNRYAYVMNNPTTLTDPLGLDATNCTPNGNGGLSCSGADSVNVTATPLNACGDPEGFTEYAMYGAGGPCPSFIPGPSTLIPPTGFIGSGGGGGTGGTSWWGMFGVRAQGQSWSQCMAANSGNYSIAGVSKIQNGAGQLALGNDVASLAFGNADEGAAGLLFSHGGSKALEGGVGAAMTYGRRTSSIMSLNLEGVPGRAPMVLGKTGAEGIAEWLSGIAEFKFAIDVGFTGAEAAGCAIHR